MLEGNPFYHRGPVSDQGFFFGRSRELTYLFDLLRKGQSVAVAGPRRIGKTSLLMHLMDPAVAAAHDCAPEKMDFLLLDGGMLDGLGEEDFYGAVGRALGGESASLTYSDLLEHIRGAFAGGRR